MRREGTESDRGGKGGGGGLGGKGGGLSLTGMGWEGIATDGDEKGGD